MWTPTPLGPCASTACTRSFCRSRAGERRKGRPPSTGRVRAGECLQAGSRHTHSCVGRSRGHRGAQACALSSTLRGSLRARPGTGSPNPKRGREQTRNRPRWGPPTPTKTWFGCPLPQRFTECATRQHCRPVIRARPGVSRRVAQDPKASIGCDGPPDTDADPNPNQHAHTGLPNATKGLKAGGPQHPVSPAPSPALCPSPDPGP